MLTRGALLLGAVLALSSGVAAAAPPRTEPLNPPKAAKPPPAKPQPDQAQRLDMLYERLATTKRPALAERIAAMIEAMRLESGSDTVDLLTGRALDALKRKDSDAAIRLFDAVVAIAPDYVEGWNQRAMLYYAKGDFGRTMRDLHEVLRRDPRQWEAWGALGRILEDSGDDLHALAAYRRALAIYPALQGIATRAERLAARVDGRSL
ncbi:MAG TPA: tetratricopeptide repeat protein [Hyphomicrobiales bacterium]|nr:tetratricopeptide repeat protein [Hyphomicrobiales bacterium]